MSGLRFLDLRANALSTVPDWLAQLPSLENLDLRWNRLTALPAAFRRLEERGCLIYT